jgi:beta-lactamase regulating signal transducer with metallopeptidase domain
MIGIVKPVILLPTSLATGLVPTQLEALVTHELAHIRRYDSVVNLFQRIVEATLFFHPAVWYVSRRVSVERENACDDSVLSAGWQAENQSAGGMIPR